MNRLSAIVAVAAFAFAASAEAGTISGEIKSKKKKYKKGTVVYVESARGAHPPPAKPVRMDQEGSRFIPKILPILLGTTVEYMNSDPTTHNVYSPDGEKFDLGNWDIGGSRSYKFEKLGVYTHLCKLHPTMLAHVVVLQNPYYAITGKDGKFTIKGVPAGKHTLKVWNPRRKADPVTVDSSKDVTGVEIKLKR